MTFVLAVLFALVGIAVGGAPPLWRRFDFFRQRTIPQFRRDQRQLARRHA